MTHLSRVFAKMGFLERVRVLDWVQPSLRDGARFYLPDPALKRRAIVGSSLRDVGSFESAKNLGSF
jgi:hypothetical protein